MKRMVIKFMVNMEMEKVIMMGMENMEKRNLTHLRCHVIGRWQRNMRMLIEPDQIRKTMNLTKNVFNNIEYLK
jgi:hypothetical protein